MEMYGVGERCGGIDLAGRGRFLLLDRKNSKRSGCRVIACEE